MSIPVGLIAVSSMIDAATASPMVLTPGGIEKKQDFYGFIDSYTEYLGFLGANIVLGMTVPAVFETVRAKM